MGNDPFASPSDPRSTSYEGDTPDWWDDDEPSLTVVDSGAYKGDDVPEKAADVIGWIDAAEDEPDERERAQLALSVERKRDKMRATVTDRIDRAIGDLIG